MRTRTALLLGTALLLSLPASPAFAADPCTTIGGNHVDVTFTSGTGLFNLYLDAGGTYKLDYFDVGGVFVTDTCDNLLATAVTSVTVTGDTDPNFFAMMLSGGGGAFPLSTPFTISLGSGFDIFAVLGTTGPDSFIVGPYAPFGGAFSLDRNGDGVAEDQISASEDVTLYGTDGNDRLSGGAGGNFQASPFSVEMYGGSGRDILIGGTARDYMFGDGGRDWMYGGKGKDRMVGGFGADRMWGQAGRDRLVGDAGGDRLYGGPGGDRLVGGTGNDHLRGGPGSDYCNGGTGTNTTAGCESFGFSY